MPNVAAALTSAIPFCLRHGIRDSVGSKILVASHYFQNTVGIVSNGVEPNKLVRHWNG